MTVPFSTDLYQAVVPGGTITLTQMFETFLGSGQGQQVSGATITITRAGVPVVGPTGTGLVSADLVTWTYTWTPARSAAAGDYLATFAGTGANGPIAYTQAVTVAAPPSLIPSPGTYASPADYQEWSGDTQTPQAQVGIMLRRATEVIDRALIGAAYATDANSMPSDPGIINVLMRATCAQCQFMLANNDPAAVKSQYSYTSQGGMQVSRAASAQGQVFPPLAPQAAAILQTAGALPGAALLGW